MSVGGSLSAIGIIGFVGSFLVVGLLTDYLFKRTGFSYILILLKLSYAIGQVYHILDMIAVAPSSQVIASLALVVIIYNGGIGIDIARVIS